MKLFVNLYGELPFSCWNPCQGAIYLKEEDTENKYELDNYISNENKTKFIGTFEIDVKQKRTVWVNVYREEDGLVVGSVYPTKEEAFEKKIDSQNAKVREIYIGTYPIEIEV